MALLTLGRRVSRHAPRTEIGEMAAEVKDRHLLKCFKQSYAMTLLRRVVVRALALGQATVPRALHFARAQAAGGALLPVSTDPPGRGWMIIRLKSSISTLGLRSRRRPQGSDCSFGSGHEPVW